MKKTILAALMGSVAFGAFANQPVLQHLEEVSPYYGGERATKVAPNGALISDGMYQSIIDPAEKQGTYVPGDVTHVNVAAGVHTFNMGGIVNVQVVETDNGIIIYDTGDHLPEGEHFYKEIRKVTDKPIKAIMYSHEHYAGGAQYFVDAEAERGNTDIMIIGHWNHNDSMRSSLVGKALHKEVSDILVPRTLNQFYNFADQEGVRGCGHTHTIDITQPIGSVDVNTPITIDGEEMVIDGRKFVFYIDDITTDTENQLMVHVPDQDIVLNTMIWGYYPNIYSIRGGSYRNPEIWVKGLEKMEALEPKILLNAHATSTSDHASSLELIHTFQDGITATVNQTLLSMLKGEQRNEAAYNVRLPDTLVDRPILRQNYGEIVTMVPQIYSAVLGSFNGEAADAVPMHPVAEADMIVRGMGGQKATLKFAQGELEDGNFHYAVQLGKHLVNNDPNHQDSIDFKTEALYAMAESTESHNLRSWYLTKAKIINGEVTLPAALPASAAMVKNDVLKYVDNYRVRLNHEKAGDTHAKIGFQFGDGKEMALEIRNGVSYSRDSVADADVVIKMSDEQFTTLYNNLSSVGVMVDSGEATLVSGDIKTATELMDMFEVIYDWQNDKGLQFLMSQL